MEKWLAHGFVLLWLLFIALTVWSHTKKAEVPPLYDAFSYFVKGQNFWKNFSGKKFVNPFDLPPTLRPPGTVLMSFPFGPSTDFRPFYFRSVFFPILCFVLAIYLAAFDGAMPVQEQWNLAILAIFLSSLPLFYHFEASDELPFPVFWGLIDNFFAGTACLAAGASVRSLKRRSLLWWVIAVLFGSFSLLVKPAGVAIMAAMDLAWGCGVLIEYRGAGQQERRKLRGLLAFGLLGAIAIEGIVLDLSLRSQYLGHENLVAGGRALHSFQTYVAAMIPLKLVHQRIYTSFGYILPATGILLPLLGGLKWKTNVVKRSLRALPGITAAAGLTLLVGLWFWIVTTRISEIRYFYPFALATITFSVPLILMMLSEGTRRAVQCVRIVWIIPCLNLALLLIQGQAPVNWRKWSGVSLVSGNGLSEVAQAQRLIDQVRNKGENATAYALDIGLQTDIFASVADYASILDPRKPRLTVKVPIGWEGAPVFRAEDFEYSDFLLFRPISDADTTDALLRSHPIRDFSEEGLLFRAWLSTVTNNDGLVAVSDIPIRILKVTDRLKLRASLDRLVGQHSWPQTFVEANAQEWWTPTELQKGLRTFQPQITDVDFDGRFVIRALSLQHTTGSVTIRVWWQSTRGYEGDWNFFCHIIDDTGKMLDNYAAPLRGHAPPSDGRPIHLTVVTFDSPTILHAYGVAVGIYKAGADGLILRADRGIRDWGGQRLILPFDPVPAK